MIVLSYKYLTKGKSLDLIENFVTSKYNLKNLSEIYDISLINLINLLKNNNIEIDPKETFIDKNYKIQDIIDLYVIEKYSLKRLSKKLNIYNETIKFILEYFNINIRTDRNAWKYITNIHTIEKITKLYKEKKLSIKEISEEMDISEFSVKKILDDANIPLKSYRRKKEINKNMVQKIIHLYVKEEWTMAAIGKYFGLAEKYISDVLKESNIEIKYTGLKDRVTANEVDFKDKEKIIELRKQGHTARSIAAELNLTYKKVVEVLTNDLEKIN